MVLILWLFQVCYVLPSRVQEHQGRCLVPLVRPWRRSLRAVNCATCLLLRGPHLLGDWGNDSAGSARSRNWAPGLATCPLSSISFGTKLGLQVFMSSWGRSDHPSAEASLLVGNDREGCAGLVLVCAGSKTKTQKPLGLLQPLSIPSWLLWQDVGGGAAAGKADAPARHRNHASPA